MLETAYVLPVMVGVLLFVVEVVAFSMNSFAANDVLTDVHTAILTEVSAVSNFDSDTDAPISPVYAFCDGSNVKLNTGSNPSIANLVETTLATKGIAFLSGHPAIATITPSVVSGFDVYVINFSGVANSLVLPEMLEVFLPINVDTIVSIKDSCSL